MYELIWDFFFNTLCGMSSTGFVFCDSFGLNGFFQKMIIQTSATSTQTIWSLAFGPSDVANLFSHVMTIICLSLLVVAFIKLIKGLFKVVGGGFKW